MNRLDRLNALAAQLGIPAHAASDTYGTTYRKTAVIFARPLRRDDAECIALGRIALNDQQDREEVMAFFDGKNEAVGMVATDPSNPADRWYIGRQFFVNAYEPE